MISVFDKEKLEIRRKEKKLQPYKIKQIYKEIFDNSNISFQEMTTLSKELRDESEKEISILPYSKREIIEGKTSTKFLIHVDEKQIIESILMHHYHTINGEKKINRFTLCVSSQV